jgi:hypothetical protein
MESIPITSTVGRNAARFRASKNGTGKSSLGLSRGCVLLKICHGLCVQSQRLDQMSVWLSQVKDLIATPLWQKLDALASPTA